MAVHGGIAPSIAHAPAVAGHHFRGRNPFVYWPGGGGFYYEPSSAAPFAEMPQPEPQRTDVRYTYTYDVPWDWVHRYPPNVVPSDRPYVPSCPSESVTVPGRGGETTVNIMRCY